MSPLLHSVSLVSAAMAGGLFSAIWEGALLAACAALCLRLLPRMGGAARSLVWMHVFLLLLLLHVLPHPDSYLGARQLSGSAIQASRFHLNPLWSLAIAGLWLALSLWRGAQLAVSAIHLRRVAARAVRVQPEAPIQALLEGGSRSRCAELCTSAEVERPSVAGFFHPRILLPLGLYGQLSASELEQIVLHEMEHLRRGDNWTNLAQKAALALFPLNPVLSWVERRLSAERELACDDRVLRSTGAPKAYAVCLTRLAEYSIVRRSLSLALGAWERRPELARRVHRILRRPDAPMNARWAMLATGSLILGAAAGSVMLARSPQLVSFAPHAPVAVQARALATPDTRPMNLGAFAGSPLLVKAVLPRRAPQRSNHANIQLAAASQRSARRQPAPARPAWIVLAEWRDAESPPQAVFALIQDRRSSFAAVATANGWLIFQI